MRNARILRTTLKRTLQSLLQPLSFRQRNFTWNRVSGDFVDVVSVQWGSLDTQEKYSFTINIGVIWPPAFEATWQKPLPAFADETVGTVRARLGELAVGNDYWWDSSIMSDEQMLADARSKLESAGLPFVERMHSLQEMEALIGKRERHLRYPPEVIALSMLRERLGDLDAARRVLAEER